MYRHGRSQAGPHKTKGASESIPRKIPQQGSDHVASRHPPCYLANGAGRVFMRVRPNTAKLDRVAKWCMNFLSFCLSMFKRLARKQQPHPMQSSEMKLRPANQGIRDFLASYCRRESPKYAIMISGEWGSGKTWLVNKIMSLMKQEGIDHFRISLFGISTRQEVYDEIFAQCHPMLASPGTKVIAGIARGILSRVTFPIGTADMQSQSQLESLGLKELMINVKNKIIILDDFERCRLNVRESLGLISNLLEEDDCKVIIISNDNQIQDEEYASYKEKVIAYTFKAEPEAELALDSFWNVMARHHLSDKSVNEIKEIIGIVHDKSGYENLRNLKISLEAFERLYSCLPDSAKEKGELVKELLYINSIFSYEVLHGAITGDQVISLFSNLLYGFLSDSRQTESDPIGMLANKYRPSLAKDLILDSDTWINLFSKGSLDARVVQDSIKLSRFFIDQRTPTWQRILKVHSIGNDELRDLLEQLQLDIKNECFSNVGEVLHVTGILLWLNRHGLYAEPPEEIVNTSIALLKSLHSQHKLEYRPIERLYSEKDNVFANIEYFERSSPSFQEVLDHAKTMEKEIHQSKLTSSANNLMNLLPDDVVGFCRQLVHRHLGDNHFLSGKYAEEPILASIDSSSFVEALMGLHTKPRRELLCWIAKRYKNSEAAKKLVDELQWLETVQDGLQREVDGLDGSIEAIQLRGAINDYVIPSINNLRAASIRPEAPQDPSEVVNN